ncbi:MAG: SPOR domain-containing protein [Gammaproteobacteria bacterium]|nr:SPOR domain-containing protein [Gammaproteobacteria bacterium]
MRWLVIVLLVANVGFAAWQLNERIRHPVPRPASAGAEGSIALPLIDELDTLPPARTSADAGTESGSESGSESESGSASEEAAPAQAAATGEAAAQVGAAPAGDTPGAQTPAVAQAGEPAAAAAVEEPASAPAGATSGNLAGGGPFALCMRYGPLRDGAQADTLGRWLGQRDVAWVKRAEDGETRKFFWVYLEPSASADQAESRLTDLKRRGVTDYMLIRRGGLANAISLGLFSSQESVNRRLAELADRGYQPVVVPRYETTKVWWLVTGVRGAADMTTLLAGAPVTTAGHEIDCAEIAPAGTRP